MPTPARHFRPAPLVLLLTLLFLGPALAAAATKGPSGGKEPAWTILQASTSHPPIPLADDDTVNPLRGYYRWRGQELVPQAEPSLDAYQRYQWRELETAAGVYDFRRLLADRQQARDEGRKFAFRLRMMTGYDNDEVHLPAYLVGHPECVAGCGFWADADPADPQNTFLPDWNDPLLLARARALLQALAAALGNTDDIGWIDVGLYGKYGEWSLDQALYQQAPAGIGAPTAASKREFARMHFEAFPAAQHVMFVPYSNKDALTWGLLEQTITAKPVGLRVDCLSRDGYFNQWSNRPLEWAAFAERWRIAPFIAEFCVFESGDPLDNPATARQQAAAYHISLVGNGNFATSWPDAERWSSLTSAEQQDLLMLGRETGYRYVPEQTQLSIGKSGLLQLSASFANLGNAPSYEPWTVAVELLDSRGLLAWQAPLAVDLGSLHGGGSRLTVQQSWTLPSTLSSGTYTLRLVARDPRRDSNPAYARPLLRWAVLDRDADGALSIAQLRRR